MPPDAPASCPSFALLLLIATPQPLSQQQWIVTPPSFFTLARAERRMKAFN